LEYSVAVLETIRVSSIPAVNFFRGRYPDGSEVTSAEFRRQELKRIERPPAAGRATKGR
jgi:hypothetical protein